MSSLRFETVDKIKGLLIILVIYGHISYDGSFFLAFSHIKNFIYIFHMPMFLFISGFFFRLIHNKKDLYKLFRVLILPYIIFYLTYLCALLYLTKHAASLSFSNEIHAFSDALYYLLIEPLASYWYLHTLILFSMLFSSFKLFFNRFVSERMSLFFASIAVFYAVHYLECLGVKVRVWVFFYLFLGYFTCFFLQEKFFLIIKYKTVFFISLFSVLLILNNYTVIQVLDDFILRLIFSLSLLCMFFKFLESFDLSFLRYLGKGSIVLFLLHVYPLNLVKIFKGWFLRFDSSGILFVIISISFTVFFSLATVLILDRLKLSRFLFGRGNIVHNMKV